MFIKYLIIKQKLKFLRHNSEKRSQIVLTYIHEVSPEAYWSQLLSKFASHTSQIIAKKKAKCFKKHAAKTGQQNFVIFLIRENIIILHYI